jgi:hypothetical protein
MKVSGYEEERVSPSGLNALLRGTSSNSNARVIRCNSYICWVIRRKRVKVSGVFAHIARGPAPKIIKCIAVEVIHKVSEGLVVGSSKATHALWLPERWSIRYGLHAWVGEEEKMKARPSAPCCANCTARG